MTRSLSTTSYAVLGLLALRPLTPYELTQQMRRSLDHSWPTSERSLYDQPERLVELGLASVVIEGDGSSGRRRYGITDEGREALRAWLATDSGMPRFQNEPLLRLILADQGTAADLHRTLASLRAHVADRRREGVEQMRPYLAGEGLYQERAHLVTLAGDLVNRLLDTLDDWASDVAELTADWPTTVDNGLSEDVRKILERLVESADRRL
jgi:DNA-binding PadR family transcriptional regulator